MKTLDDINKSGVNLGPVPLQDTAANLASSNPVVASGRLAIATDTKAMALGDGTTAWNSLPKYYPDSDPVILSATAPQSTLTTSIVDLTGLSGLIFTVGARPWVVELDLSWIDTSAAYTGVLGYISTSTGTALNEMMGTMDAAGNGSVHVKHWISAAGSYNLKAQLQILSGGGTGALGAGFSQLRSYFTARPG